MYHENYYGHVIKIIRLCFFCNIIMFLYFFIKAINNFIVFHLLLNIIYNKNIYNKILNRIKLLLREVDLMDLWIK